MKPCIEWKYVFLTIIYIHLECKLVIEGKNADCILGVQETLA